MKTKTIVRVTQYKSKANKEAKEINLSLNKRNIKREAYVCEVSEAYVKTLTRTGYKIPKKNYAICIRNKPKVKK